MKFVVHTLGCKVNQYEGQAMIERLLELGHTATTDIEFADAYIFNTCSVTAEADRKSRQLLAKARKYNSEAPVYVCGCSSQNAPEQYEDRPNVHIISGTSAKMDLLNFIMSDIAGISGGRNMVQQPPAIYEDNLRPKHTRKRAYIKIQDGCNHFCSYCIVPYLRGRSRSRSIDSVLAEARRSASETGEIVLTGIDLSAYGKDIGTDLTELIRAFKTVPVRKRLGSLECGIITDSFLEAVREADFCEHFHMSLQSGCDGVLKRMNRHYTVDTFMRNIEKIRAYFPDAGITTDIIAGFPAETEAEHRESFDNVRAMRFSDIHVFPYSVRKGTAAAGMEQVAVETRTRRAEEFGLLKRELKVRFLQSQLHTKQEVYFEEKEDWAVGYTRNYIKTYAPASPGDIKNILLKQIYKEGVKGEIYE